MKNIYTEYKTKLISADEAVRFVKCGDNLFYSEYALFPEVLDKAISKRIHVLKNINLRSAGFSRVPEIAEADPDCEHVMINEWQRGSVSRSLHDKRMCDEIPLCYHQGPGTIRNYCDFNVSFITTGEMDKSGYFNYGLSNSLTGAALSKSKCIILEVNKSVPYCHGGRGESIHISGVDYIVEGNHAPLAEVKSPLPAKEDRRIAEHIVKEIEDGACLCLGIDGVSNLIGQLIAASDLKDLGIHAEMLGDSCVDLYNAGKITGRNKSVDPFKMVYTYALGSKKLYDFLDRHPACASYPANYTNNPAIIAQNDKVVAIHPAVEVDLYGQVCSETLSEDRQSGTAGQLDFTFGAFMSKGGKGIMTLRSAYRDHEGIRRSRIVPKLASGSIVTVPGSIVQYVATEYGIAELNGKSIRERADALIGIAHPEFREELIRQAGKIKI